MILKRKKNEIFFLTVVVVILLIFSLIITLSNKNLFFKSLSDLREKFMTYDHGFSSTKNLFGMSTFISISSESNFIIDVVKNLPSNIYKSIQLKTKGFPNRPVMETIEININFKNYKKILDDRKSFLVNMIALEPTDVNATVHYNGKKYDANLRLKGDLRDHWDSVYRMSFRVDLKNGSIFGLKRFSLQKSRTRHHPYDQTFGKLIQDLGNLSPYQTYARIIVNGENWGIMNIEEHMSRELLEKQKHKESVIVKFGNEKKWAYDKINQKTRYPHYKLGDSKLNLMTYGEKKYLQSPIYRMWSSYIANERLKNSLEIYDFDSFSKAYVLALFWGYWHPLYENNSRYYFDPYLLKLKPITTDQLQILNLDSRKSKDNDPPDPYKYLINNLSFREHVKKNFSLVKSISSNAQKYIDYYQSYFPADNIIEIDSLLKKNISSIEDFSNNYLFPKLNQNDQVNIELPTKEQAKSFTEHIHARHFINGKIEIYNLLPDKIKIKNIRFENKIISQNIDLDGFKINQNIPLNINTKIYGIADKQIVIKTEYKDIVRDYIIETSFIPGPYFNPLTDIGYTDRPFLEKKDDNEWLIKKGNWDISQPLFLNGKVTIEAGTNLNFINESYLIIEGQIIALGKSKEKILLGSNTSWKGIYVIGNEKKSILKNVEISNTSFLQDGLLQLTGGLNFYNSQVLIEDTLINNSNAEDALNIINSNFKLENVKISNANSDCFDSDFSYGMISNSNFNNCGGDAIDFSGGKVDVYNSSFKKIYDKAVSAGESTNLNLQNIYIQDVGVGIASKDGSVVSAKNIKINNYQISPIMTYLKKDFYMQPSMTGVNIEIEPYRADAFLAQKDTYMSINNQQVDTKEINVEALYQSEIMKK